MGQAICVHAAFQNAIKITAQRCLTSTGYDKNCLLSNSTISALNTAFASIQTQYLQYLSQGNNVPQGSPNYNNIATGISNLATAELNAYSACVNSTTGTTPDQFISNLNNCISNNSGVSNAMTQLQTAINPTIPPGGPPACPALPTTLPSAPAPAQPPIQAPVTPAQPPTQAPITPAQPPPSTSTPAAKSSSAWIWIIIAIVVVLILIGLGIGLFFLLKKK